MTDFSSFRILVDMPTRDPALGFQHTASGLADLIRHSEPQFTIGIFGSWGSGKTTLMNAIKSELRCHRIVTVDFSAWRYEKEEHLLVPLLDTIRQALVNWAEALEADRTQAAGIEDSRRERLAKTALKTAGTVGKVMASILAGLSFKVGLPGAVQMTYDANKALAAVKGTVGADQAAVSQPDDKSDDGTTNYAIRRADPRLPQSVYHACFNALQAAFLDFATETDQTRIVVFVDDLDRCLPNGALAVLESMKLFFDLSGFVFVVGLDREVVERCVDARYANHQPGAVSDDDTAALSDRIVRGADYLKKIFQVPYSLAPIAVDQIDDLIQSLQVDSGLAEDQVEDLRNRVRPHLDFLVAGNSINPREVKRFINAYTLQMKVKSQLHPDAVIALQTITFRSDCEQIADALRAYGLEFTSALRMLIDGDGDALADFEIGVADVPQDLRVYLAPGGPGRALIEVENVDDYLYAGEAARSTAGGVYVDLLRAFGELRGALAAAVAAENREMMEYAWSESKSHASKMLSMVQSIGVAPQLKNVIQEFERLQAWTEERESGAWSVLRDSFDGPGGGRSDELQESVKSEFETRVGSVRASIRRLRRLARLSGSEAF